MARLAAAVCLLVASTACSNNEPANPGGSSSSTTPAADAGGADVLAVEANGEAGDYQLAVTLKSPDTGCDRYADWWEVVGPDGDLLYRRILAHSHVDEQPFTRSGGPVDAQPDTTLVVRAHMSVGGYGGTAMRGTVTDGFTPASDVGADFEAGLASEAPLPDGCAF